MCNPSPPFSAGGLSLWLVVWLVLVKPTPVRGCPRMCVCYPSPMTVSCQSQNFTSVPAGVPYDSQRVFLQNNRITQLRVDSFGFQTQVRTPALTCAHLRTCESTCAYLHLPAHTCTYLRTCTNTCTYLRLSAYL